MSAWKSPRFRQLFRFLDSSNPEVGTENMEKKHRWFNHPMSYFQLVIAGFSLVSLPLIVALITGAFYVDRLTSQSQEAVYRAVQGTQTSRILLEQITTMERYVRQFLVLKDSLLLESYEERHRYYVDTSVNLMPLLLDDNLRSRLLMLNRLENELYRRLMDNKLVDKGTQVNAEELIALTELAKLILHDSSLLIDSEMEIMHHMSEQAQEIIYWELLAVVPGAVIFTVIFVILLSRPVRQIEGAITRLGDGEFDEEIKVNGPRDIEYLGQRLDWLRLRLKYLEEKKVKFLHYVSHDLKTPLTAIRESAELLSEEVIGPLTKQQKEVSQILKNSSVNLQKMIEKLLSFNMPGAADFSMGMTSVDLRGLVDTVLADHKPVILAKQLKVSKSCEKINYPGDQEQLRTVIDNLVSNAIKYTPESGEINIKLWSDADKVLFDVSDTGPGIHPNEREKVFEAFYRTPHSEKEQIQGSGLGLSIVREFVESHKGDIEVLDDSMKGAHFRVSLPQRAKEEEGLAWAV